LDSVLVKHTLLTALLAMACILTPSSVSAADNPPAVFLLNPTGLVEARTGLSQAQLSAVRDHAESALTRGPFSVTEKRVPPPSGDVHDYVSLSIYWWPDPAASSGLPYIQRDGIRNTDADDTSRYDANPLTRMVGDVESLALAYYLTRSLGSRSTLSGARSGSQRYAEHAAVLLRTWFLDPATRMNPNFRFAQIIPGRDAIRGTGIIESRRFTRIVDSVALLSECACWSAADQQGLRDWFKEFETWLRSSPNGRLEARTTNNHAVWYDVQLVDFALFAGDRQAAVQVLNSVPSARIDTQISADGSTPRELERTRSLHYSNFNLQAFFELATLGQQVGVDLWSYQSPDGASLRGALDFLTPYMAAGETWPYDEITDVDAFQENAQTLARASAAYPDGGYADLLAHLAEPQSAYDLLLLGIGHWPD
jgi:hypothetical protein